MIILLQIKQREKVGWHKLGKQYTLYVIAVKTMKKMNLDSEELFIFSLNFSQLLIAIRMIIGMQAHI